MPCLERLSTFWRVRKQVTAAGLGFNLRVRVAFNCLVHDKTRAAKLRFHRLIVI